MPLLDVAAMNASLDNDYGSSRGPHAAGSHELVLLASDPALLDAGEDPADLELDPELCPGYARVVVVPGAWAAAEGGMKTTTDLVTLSAPTDVWQQVATHFALRDPDTGIWWDSAPLLDPLTITAAGDPPTFKPVVFHDDAVPLA